MEARSRNRSHFARIFNMADWEVTLEGLETAIPVVQQLLQDCSSCFVTDDIDIIQEQLHDLEKAEELLSCFISAFNDFSLQIYQDIVTKLNDIVNVLDRYRTHYEQKFNFLEMRIRSLDNSKVKLLQTGCVGRPKLIISEDQVAGLRSLRMSWKKIADLLGVSTDTLRRRRLEFRNDFRYEERSDSELDHLLAGILERHPCVGERMLQGHLLLNGHLIQRARVRESLTRIDPERSKRFN